MKYIPNILTSRKKNNENICRYTELLVLYKQNKQQKLLKF